MLRTTGTYAISTTLSEPVRAFVPRPLPPADPPLAPAGIFAPAMFVAMGNGVGQPNGIAGAISIDPTRAGAASGIVGFLQMALGAVGTVIVGHTLGSTLLPVALVIVAFAIVSALSFLLATTRSQGLQGPADR